MYCFLYVIAGGVNLTTLEFRTNTRLYDTVLFCQQIQHPV